MTQNLLPGITERYEGLEEIRQGYRTGVQAITLELNHLNGELFDPTTVGETSHSAREPHAYVATYFDRNWAYLSCAHSDGRQLEIQIDAETSACFDILNYLLKFSGCGLVYEIDSRFFIDIWPILAPAKPLSFRRPESRGHIEMLRPLFPAVSAFLQVAKEDLWILLAGDDELETLILPYLYGSSIDRTDDIYRLFLSESDDRTVYEGWLSNQVVRSFATSFRVSERVMRKEMPRYVALLRELPVGNNILA